MVDHVAPGYRSRSTAPHRINTLRGNRFRLVTLGRPTLRGAAGDEDASLAKRRRKLALLAVLAMARRPVARDTLIELFWGEQEEARARHSLSNALSSLRRALGQQSITTRDADVALAPDAPLDVDALEIGDAAEARDFARVVELYGGPFLDGVHVNDSPSFDQWLTRERRRLEAVFLQACNQQCASLARARRWPECHALAARWIEADPLSPDAALYILNATKAPGTRAALVQALDEFDQLRVRLARDYEVAPSPVVRDLETRIREQLATLVPVGLTESVESPIPEPVAPEPPPPSPVPPSPRTRVAHSGARSVRSARPPSSESSRFVPPPIARSEATKATSSPTAASRSSRYSRWSGVAEIPLLHGSPTGSPR